MKRTQITVAAVGVLALVGGGTALASKGRGHGQQLRVGVVGHRLHGPGALLDAAAGYLGIAPSALVPQLRSGKTLADVANATQGKTAQGLVDALVAVEKKDLDDAVAKNRLTGAQAARIAQELTQRTSDFVNGTFRGHGPPPFGGHRGGDDLQVAADYLGTTASALLTQLQGGKTLAAIANATSGKSASGLVAALVAHEQAEHPGAPTDELTTRVTMLVNGTFPRHDHRHGLFRRH
ncbi:MAG TPA: hypothetical protein VFA56_01225 [Gaiellaceae bacterium]|nr:hypothetical protein [Gaiellaceae bacterium]